METSDTLKNVREMLSLLRSIDNNLSELLKVVKKDEDKKEPAGYPLTDKEEEVVPE